MSSSKPSSPSVHIRAHVYAFVHLYHYFPYTHYMGLNYIPWILFTFHHSKIKLPISFMNQAKIFKICRNYSSSILFLNLLSFISLSTGYPAEFPLLEGRSQQTVTGTQHANGVSSKVKSSRVKYTQILVYYGY